MIPKSSAERSVWIVYSRDLRTYVEICADGPADAIERVRSRLPEHSRHYVLNAVENADDDLSSHERCQPNNCRSLWAGYDQTDVARIFRQRITRAIASNQIITRI